MARRARSWKSVPNHWKSSAGVLRSVNADPATVEWALRQILVSPVRPLAARGAASLNRGINAFSKEERQAPIESARIWPSQTGGDAIVFVIGQQIGISDAEVEAARGSVRAHICGGKILGGRWAIPKSEVCTGSHSGRNGIQKVDGVRTAVEKCAIRIRLSVEGCRDISGVGIDGIDRRASQTVVRLRPNSENHRAVEAGLRTRSLRQFNNDAVVVGGERGYWIRDLLSGRLRGHLTACCRTRVIKAEILSTAYTNGTAITAILYVVSNSHDSVCAEARQIILNGPQAGASRGHVRETRTADNFNRGRAGLLAGHRNIRRLHRPPTLAVHKLSALGNRIAIRVLLLRQGKRKRGGQNSHSR